MSPRVSSPSRASSSLAFSVASVSRHAARQSSSVTSMHGRFPPPITQQIIYRGFATSAKARPLTFPALSPTMTEGRIVKWLKKEGESIKAGDAMFSVETDKATMDCEATEDGVLGKILVSQGENMLPVGQVIAYVLDEGTDPKSVDYPKPDSSPTDKPAAQADKKPTQQQQQPSPSPPSTQTPPPTKSAPSTPSSTPPSAVKSADASASASPSSHHDDAPMWPSVRRLLMEHNLDPSSISASGPKGVLLKGDVLQALAQGSARQASSKTASQKQPSSATTSPDQKPASTPSPYARASALPPYEDIPNNNIRKVIAKRLTESKTTIPHLYVAQECEIDALLALRTRINSGGSVKLSVNDFVIRAAALALRDVPSLNVYFVGGEEVSKQQKSVDISIAVATDKGLITPIVKEADKKTLGVISDAVKGLALKAKEGKLRPDEFQGGSFSISNLGMFGIAGFSAVINPPQACILAVGEGKKKLVLDTTGESAKPRLKTVIEATLSCDARVVNEDDAAKFLEVFNHYLSSPENMLL